MGLMERLSKDVERLVASNHLEQAASSVRERLRYERDKVVAPDIYSALSAKRKIPEGAIVFAHLETETKPRVIGYKEAIEEFSKKYPKHGAILQDIIKRKKNKKTESIVYGLSGSKDLPEEFYVNVLMGVLKVKELEARKLYSSLEIISEDLEEKKEEAESRIIIKG